MAFIELDDLPASIHEDILDALVKKDEDKITANINRSIDEVAAYLNGRYDTNALFSAVGNARNQYILRLTLEITMFYLYKLHNPRKLTQVTIDSYERTLEILAEIRDGKQNPVGLPLPEIETPGSGSGDGTAVQWGSDCQLGSNW